MLETKVLKQRVRDCIDPGKDLGHSDVHGKKKADRPEDAREKDSGQKTETEGVQVKRNEDGTICEECK